MTRGEVGEASSAQVQAVVHGYLVACEQGDVALARSFLAPGARITFPGTLVYDDLGEWWSDFRRRFAWLRKCDHQYDVDERADGRWVLVCRGTLAGRTREGREFSGVRFLDRFEVVGDKIVDQQVWNDVAHHGLLASDPSHPKEG